MVAFLEMFGRSVGPSATELGHARPHITPGCYYDASLQDRPMTVGDVRKVFRFAGSCRVFCGLCAVC